MARSAHHALISAVGDAHPAFCGTVRVAKRWAQQQLLSQHLGQEALELVCAAAFTQPALTAPPGTGHECVAVSSLSRGCVHTQRARLLRRCHVDAGGLDSCRVHACARGFRV